MQNKTNHPNLIHDLNNQDKKNSLSLTAFFSLLSITIVIGLLIGFFLAKIKPATGPTLNSKKTTIKKTAGIADTKTFKDKAEGILKEGGIDGEGNFHLERPGGESQNVYLTSSTVDLSQYLGKKIRVWGETFTAQKAGWLMDVGLVEVLQ